ncbi:Transcriptional regulator GlxA family, contains an amidase domain and an AraC-type DNA-binding HTH domain [Blastococcus aurantiacus]|uniref:Transcriptional regulator GlxA family, contains an amidase domain and an AraC-type DNA-binding HTH domain n=1 Tax=Blastococcus aurantiacus TaxID=1550231 RepID=A0A1G7HCQ8_9ACTN|nr:Transcriptional regulator GlxA family, contains an amidase domain and an AraC-type DNA-binding HTH domain [Blastococcus aurantiacus]
MAVALFEGVELLDVSGPAEVLATATRLLAADARPGYAVTMVAASPDPVVTSNGVRLLPDTTFAELTGHWDTFVVPGALQHGGRLPDAVVDTDVVDWLAARAGDAGRVAAVCAGARTVALAGLLDGRRATTHWAVAAALAAHHPEVEVDPDPIFIRSGDVWTSAGVTAGMDLALALVEADHGRALALEVARWLVMYVKRPGGQSQFSVALSMQRPERDDVAALPGWIAENLTGDLSVAALAARARLSERHFARVFAEQVGSTPGAFIEAARLEGARRLLEEGRDPLPAVARACGFGSVETLHRAFRRRLGVTPAQYRERFRTSLA